MTPQFTDTHFHFQTPDMNNFSIAVVFCVFAATVISAQKCLTTCPQDCGMTKDDRGCATCHCDVNPFERPPPPPPRRPGNRRFARDVEKTAENDKKCLSTCPQDCGMTKDDKGCATCDCDVNVFQTLPPPPPRRPDNRKVARDVEKTAENEEKCLSTCPQDCGMTKDDKGCATCHCDVNPFERPPPPPPRRKVSRDAEEPASTEHHGQLCRQKCPADCGCTVAPNNETTCVCTAINHPLIRPTPPRPPCNRALPSCKEPCKLEYEETKICPVCKCPEE